MTFRGLRLKQRRPSRRHRALCQISFLGQCSLALILQPYSVFVLACVLQRSRSRPLCRAQHWWTKRGRRPTGLRDRLILGGLAASHPARVRQGLPRQTLRTTLRQSLPSYQTWDGSTTVSGLRRAWFSQGLRCASPSTWSLRGAAGATEVSAPGAASAPQGLWLTC